MPAVNIAATQTTAFNIPRDKWGARLFNNSDTRLLYRLAKNVATSGSDMGIPLDPGQEIMLCLAEKARNDIAVVAIHGGTGNKELVYDILDQQYQAVAGDVNRVGGFTLNPSANFTRPANTTAYASGDLVANDTTAGSVVPMTFTVARVAQGSVTIRKARLSKSTTTTSNAAFRLHLYTAAPTIANGDNSAWSTTRSGYLGAIDFSSSNALAFSDGTAINGVPVVGTEINVKLASGTTIVGLLEARAAYGPGSGEVFTVELELFQD